MALEKNKEHPFYQSDVLRTGETNNYCPSLYKSLANRLRKCYGVHTR